jgi:hypothetical protein
MMPQTILPFKLEKTQDKVASHAGLALFGEFIQAMDVHRQIDKIALNLNCGSWDSWATLS